MSQADAHWHVIGKYKHEFSLHFVMVFVDEQGFFLIGPNVASTCLQYKDKHLIPRHSMQSFFSAVHLHRKLYTFGGYDVTEKLQLRSCGVYSMQDAHWTANKSKNMRTTGNKARAEEFKEKFSRPDLTGQGHFNFGSRYSSPGIVFQYPMRVHSHI